MLNKKKCKAMCSSLILSLITATTLTTKVNALSTTSANNTAPASTTVASTTYSKVNNGGPLDLAIANEEKIIEMLKREGKISENATYEEAHAAYLQYMKTLSDAETEPLTKEEQELNAKALPNLLGDSQISLFAADNSEKVTEINILTVMVEFSDYKHDSIQPGETDMYYENYDKQHFQDMLFGENGYTGPNGENLVSMKQYYEEQSGGTFIMNGTVTDWYTAPNPAAYYGAQVGSSHDTKPRNLVADALKEMAKDPSINLADFDHIDRYDLDGDGDYNEKDGMIDYLIVIHAGMGQEAGGGSLGTDAIWSHSWTLGGLYPIPGTSYTDENGKTRPYYAYKYTIDPEDGAAGVFCHETGHEIGLPDEYDTQYSSDSSEPISYWSLMSSGSWAGTIPGAEPPGISAYGRQMLQNIYGGNWQNQTILNYEDLNKWGTSTKLNSAAKSGDAIRINLPDLIIPITTPTSGSYAYYGGKGQDGSPITSSMYKTIDLTKATAPILNFKTWYDIETGWDFGTVQVREVGTEEWAALKGNITTTEHDPSADVIVANGITGNSNGWVDGIFDLTAYAGKNIELKFEYQTDSYTFGQGIYIDDIAIMDNNTAIFNDDAEKDNIFTLDGFVKDTCSETATNYYLIEWRDHSGVDKGLSHINTLGNIFQYDPGMIIWYVNEFYTDNWNALHPGGGYLSIIDADQKNIPWVYSDKTTMWASNKYQMHDAAFNCLLGSKFKIDLTKEYGRVAVDKYRTINRSFKDTTDYTNPEIPTLGTKLQKLGINIELFGQKLDNSSATVKVSHR